MIRDDILLSEIDPDPQQPCQIFESLDMSDLQKSITKDDTRKYIKRYKKKN